MKIVLERFGGLAGGMRWPAVTVDGSDLSAGDARELDRLVRAARSGSAVSSEDARARDAATYRVTVDDGGTTSTFSQSDAGMNSAFALLLRWLQARDRARPGSNS